MKVLFISIFLLLAVYGCDTPNTTEKFQELSEKIQPEKQSFEIDPTQDNLITCKNGSLVFFPQNLFIRKDGSTPEGKVLIEIQEYYSYKDFISKDLSTTSDSSLLVSGGMIELNATNSGQECFITNGMAYTIFFPREQNDYNPMKLFYNSNNSDSTINWTLTPAKIFDGVTKELIDYNDEGDSLLSFVPAWSESYGFSYNPECFNLSSDIHSAFYEFISMNFVVTSEMTKFYCENPDEYYHIAIELNADARITSVETLSDSSKYDSYFETFFERTTCTFGNISPKCESHILMHFAAQVKSANADYAYSFNEKYSEYRNKALQKVNNAELNYYVLSSISLGLINCDYFYQSDAEKIDFVVTTDRHESSKVYLVFEDIRSMMIETKTNGDYFTFENVPENMNAKVVSINYSESLPMMCVERIQLTKSGINLSNFKSFSLDELDRELVNL